MAGTPSDSVCGSLRLASALAKCKTTSTTSASPIGKEGIKKSDKVNKFGMWNFPSSVEGKCINLYIALIFDLTFGSWTPVTVIKGWNSFYNSYLSWKEPVFGLINNLNCNHSEQGCRMAHENVQ